MTSTPRERALEDRILHLERELREARKDALKAAQAVVLADCVPEPKTEYQQAYNHTLMATAKKIGELG